MTASVDEHLTALRARWRDQPADRAAIEAEANAVTTLAAAFPNTEVITST